ncbi:hypothetical protein [Nocardia vulneris]|uniref:DUF4440 domain-containing protein n=1 Tax=Nocardia vulneris TaxID=1141657 RepID=A0ABR4Z5B9_9NOCA|nr:hypothetical protein [Nocardia vulneris]KIA60242.1 hypothetical protein FG87_38130 [Nocardia vulneris]
MTNILDDMKRVRDYFDKRDGFAPLALTRQIELLEREARRDLARLKEAFDAALEKSEWYGFENFEDIPSGLAEFMKAFYDAATSVAIQTTYDSLEFAPKDRQYIDKDGDYWKYSGGTWHWKAAHNEVWQAANFTADDSYGPFSVRALA